MLKRFQFILESEERHKSFFFAYIILIYYFLNNDFFFYSISFNDPVTVFCYHLISLHNDILWFILVILGLVYWSFYKIMREFGWNCFNKQIGFLKLWLYEPITFILELKKISITFFIYKKLLKIFFIFLKYISLFFYHLVFLPNTLTNYFLKKSIYTFFLGEKAELIFPEHILNNINIEKALIDKYITYKLFFYSSNARLFYSGKKSILHILKFNHRLWFEYVFAFFPTAIILWILIPSYYLLYSLDDHSYPSITVKVIGHQWYWSYEIDNSTSFNKNVPGLNLDSVYIKEEDLNIGQKRLLTTDNNLILPMGTTMRFLITSMDVLHAWSIPDFGLKIDAVPGRLNQFISLVCKPGAYYGQCSELCGVAHGFMPIVVEVLTWDQWVDYSKLHLFKNGDLSSERLKENSNKELSRLLQKYYNWYYYHQNNSFFKYISFLSYCDPNLEKMCALFLNELMWGSEENLKKLACSYEKLGVNKNIENNPINPIENITENKKVNDIADDKIKRDEYFIAELLNLDISRVYDARITFLYNEVLSGKDFNEIHFNDYDEVQLLLCRIYAESKIWEKN